MSATKPIFTPMLARAEIKRIQLQLEKELELLQCELNSLPEGTLYIFKNRKWITFYHRNKGCVRGISKNMDLVYALARRQYITMLIQFIGEFLAGLSNDYSNIEFSSLLSKFDPLFSKYELGGLDIERITMTPNQFIWNSDRHSKSTKHIEELKYPTTGRIYMRSKSEQTLGNLLEKLHIPYRYEAELIINGIAYHPDFIIMLPSGRLIIIEHVGRLDLKKYNEDLTLRLMSYNDIGLLIGRDVFFTFERDTRDEVILKEILFQILTAVPSDNKFLRRIAIRAGCHFD
ncbi:MAG: hypothetical protein K6B42_09795 [Clostridia bacterium]|nr:hypothetical protein [Clostridia bacterium]